MEAICRSNEGYAKALQDHLAVCTHIQPAKINLDTFESKLDLMLKVTGCKTKEDLIRYIVCDGEPVDESCVGHPVLTGYHKRNLNLANWKEKKLQIIHKTETRNPYLISNQDDTFLEWVWVAKKIPDYDYTRKSE